MAVIMSSGPAQRDFIVMVRHTVGNALIIGGKMSADTIQLSPFSDLPLADRFKGRAPQQFRKAIKRGMKRGFGDRCFGRIQERRLTRRRAFSCYEEHRLAADGTVEASDSSIPAQIRVEGQQTTVDVSIGHRRYAATWSSEGKACTGARHRSKRHP